jgi:hypothetical protein
VQLEELALDTYRDVNELAEWRVLQWRKAIGSRLSWMALPLRLVSFGQHLGRRFDRYRLSAPGL